jgi:tetratricopeptide (TPR) repeat protein
MRHVLSVVAGLFILIGLVPAPSTADFAEDTKLCGSSSNPDEKIAACTRQISSGRWTGRNLASAYTARATGYYRKNDYDRAIADYTEAIRIDPKYAIAYDNRGNVFHRKGDYDRAIRDYDEAIRLAPLAATYASRGLAYRNKGNFDRAIADYTEAIRLDPKLAEAHHNRGVAYLNKGDYDRAVADYTEAIRLAPSAAVPYASRGHAYSYKDDYERAIADYNQAIRLDPKYVDAYFHRGRAYESKGNFANALGDFRSALALAPNDKYADEAVRRMEQKLAARTEPKPPVSKPIAPPVVPGQPEIRIALVIGNGSYANVGALANPANDARAIAAALNGLGFKTVTLLFDLPRERLLDALKTFAREAEKADWAVIYFAGHGLELGGVNYLVPVDAKMASDRDASFEAAELQKVLDAVAEKRNFVIPLSRERIMCPWFPCWRSPRSAT